MFSPGLIVQANLSYPPFWCTSGKESRATLVIWQGGLIRLKSSSALLVPDVGRCPST